MNPLKVASDGKGVWNTMARVAAISQRYGVTPRNMDRILARFQGVIDLFDARATFPITGAALARNPGVAEKYRSAQIEFAVHGYYHVDHKALAPADLMEQFTRARELFAGRGLPAAGFRSPYLRWNEHTLAAVKAAGFLYDSSQALVWNTANGMQSESYRRVLQFYGVLPAEDYPSLPRLTGGLLRLPYSLPDDEALIERIPFKTAAEMNRVWPAILEKTHWLGELFILGLHPERIVSCESALVATLVRARELRPAVWIARLDEIAHWWRARLETAVDLTQDGEFSFSFHVHGPQGTALLMRGVEAAVDTSPWDGRYEIVHGPRVTVFARRRPLIGVSPATAPELVSFLRQQGYLVETAGSPAAHALYLDRPTFQYEDERPLLDEIEQGDFPLVRLGRWPDGARSALCISGDIDALTIWDYGLRFLGS